MRSREFNLIASILFQERIKKKQFENIDYESVIKISSSHLIIPTIYSEIQKKNLSSTLPSEFYNYIKYIYNHNLQRNKQLIEEINEISYKLNKVGIQHIFLKGSAGIISNLYKDLGSRMIGDIDILIFEKDRKNIEDFFEKNNYEKSKNEYNFFEPRHLTRRFNKDRLFAIEAHTKLFDKKDHQKLIDLEEFFSSKLSLNNLNIPSYKNQILHNVYNFQINDFGYNYDAFSLRSFFDNFLLCLRNDNKLIKIENKIFKRYFAIFSEIFPENNMSHLRLTFVQKKIFSLKNSCKLINRFINFLSYLMIKLNWLPRQFREIAINKDYRKHLKEKFL